MVIRGESHSSVGVIIPWMNWNLVGFLFFEGSSFFTMSVGTYSRSAAVDVLVRECELSKWK